MSDQVRNLQNSGKKCLIVRLGLPTLSLCGLRSTGQFHSSETLFEENRYFISTSLVCFWEVPKLMRMISHPEGISKK